MRLIDADALIETIRNFVDTMSVCTSTEYCTGLRFMKKQAIEAVENAPTVDAVPVTRCGKCKYFKDGMCYNPNTYDDEKTCGNTTADWFCADGKRNENRN